MRTLALTEPIWPRQHDTESFEGQVLFWDILPKHSIGHLVLKSSRDNPTTPKSTESHTEVHWPPDLRQTQPSALGFLTNMNLWFLDLLTGLIFGP